MPQRTIDDKSLLRCTIKKSVDVVAKLVLLASYCICGISALALAAYGALALYSISVDPIRVFLAYAWSGIAFAGSLAAMVPWYVYCGIAAVVAIPVYSLLWCIARELTEEDYQSEIAKTLSFTLIVLLGLGLMVLGMVLVLVLGMVLVLVLGMDETKPFRFLGAYLHYRKRMKEE